jgi:hypothetical protein
MVNEHIFNLDTWKRGLFILLYAMIYNVAEVVLWVTVLFQFGTRLFTGQINPRLLGFSQQLSTFIYQILLYISFKSDQPPFPLGDWPSGAPR